ncbi:MAG: hypothetical protein AAB641_00320 [Patescibacteria group bacterium]
MKKKFLSLPRAPLPRQTGGYHRPAKGRGSYNRQSEKLAVKKENEMYFFTEGLTIAEFYERRKVLARRIRKFGTKRFEQEIRAEFPTRVRNCLANWSLRDILVAPETQYLRQVGYFGRKSLHDLRAVLERHGLTIHMDPGIVDDLGFKPNL